MHCLGIAHRPQHIKSGLMDIGANMSNLVSVALLITLRWKISIHAGGAAGAATVLALLYGVQALPLLAGVALIGWSRVVLGKHTWLQVLAGAVISVIITVVVFDIGWP